MKPAAPRETFRAPSFHGLSVRRAKLPLPTCHFRRWGLWKGGQGGRVGIALETALELALKAAGKEISGKVFVHCLRTLEEFLRRPRATLAEVAVSVGVSARTVDSYVRLLQDIGILERTGARKAGSWLVTKRMVVSGSKDQT